MPKVKEKFDFSGWATKYNVKCSDGRTILPGAFRHCDGKIVPLVWEHNGKGSPSAILGRVLLKEEEEGVKAYGSFNSSETAKNAAAALMHGDIESLSINANRVEEDEESRVSKGNIREVSLVVTGANPGAFIESVFMHGEPMELGDEEAIIYPGESGLKCFMHSDDDDGTEELDEPDLTQEDVSDIIDGLSDEEKAAVAIVVGQAIAMTKTEDLNDKEKEEGATMAHSKANLFDKDDTGTKDITRSFTHSDEEAVISLARNRGMRLSEAHKMYVSENEILHADKYSGMEYGTEELSYGFKNPDILHPDYKTDQSAPIMISRPMEWVTSIINNVSRSPFAKVKSIFADITAEEARAKGYTKGKLKRDEVITLLKRTIDSTTIYKKQKIDRDDLVDITDYSVLPWLQSEMNVMLDEEKALAILLGDGRPAGSEDKVDETRIIPVVKDSELFTIRVAVEVPDDAGPEEVSNAIINTIIKTRRGYRGSGNPNLYTTEDYLGDALLLENAIGDKKYKTEQELATTLRVSSIHTVEPMEGRTVTIDGDELPLVGVIINPIDYKVGSNTLGKRSMFDQFDIDYNQQKYLIEERFSGGLVRPFSAIAIGLKKVSG